MLNSYLTRGLQQRLQRLHDQISALRQAEAKARRWDVPSKAKPLRISETTEMNSLQAG